MGCPVMPFRERRQARELERPQRELGRARGYRPQTRSRAGMVDQLLQVVADRAERPGADVERLPGDGCVETAA